MHINLSLNNNYSSEWFTFTKKTITRKTIGINSTYCVTRQSPQHNTIIYNYRLFQSMVISWNEVAIALIYFKNFCLSNLSVTIIHFHLYDNVSKAKLVQVAQTIQKNTWLTNLFNGCTLYGLLENLNSGNIFRFTWRSD